MLQLKKVHSLKMGLKFKVLKPYSPVPNNIPPPPRSLVFGFFVGTPPHPAPPLINLPDFVFCFADISEIVKTDRSFCETVSSLV